MYICAYMHTCTLADTERPPSSRGYVPSSLIPRLCSNLHVHMRIRAYIHTYICMLLQTSKDLPHPEAMFQSPAHHTPLDDLWQASHEESHGRPLSGDLRNKPLDELWRPRTQEPRHTSDQQVGIYFVCVYMHVRDGYIASTYV
jgi:hypothetical protein